MSQVILQQVVGNSYFATGVFAAGVYRYGDSVILIDSGSDEQSASRIADAIEAIGCRVTAIINTHCHADHCGGNWYFQKKYPELRVYAAYDEKFFIEDPKWAPRCFCGNAAPILGLQNKFLAPQKPSIVTDVIVYQDAVLEIDNQKLQIVTLSGHTPGSIGVITQDNVFYSGDALFGVATMMKHPVLFYTDIKQTLVTFQKMARLSIAASVLYHGGLVETMTDLIVLHEQKVLEIKNMILSRIKKGSVSIDLLTQEVMQHYKISNNVVTFTLTQTTVRAYMALLEQEGLIGIVVSDGLLQMQAVQ